MMTNSALDKSYITVSGYLMRCPDSGSRQVVLPMKEQVCCFGVLLDPVFSFSFEVARRAGNGEDFILKFPDFTGEVKF